MCVCVLSQVGSQYRLLLSCIISAAVVEFYVEQRPTVSYSTFRLAELAGYRPKISVRTAYIYMISLKSSVQDRLTPIGAIVFRNKACMQRDRG